MPEGLVPACVVLSERLGPPGEIEQRIVDRTGAVLQTAPLWTEEELVRNAADADVLVVGAPEPVTSEVLRRLPRIRCVVRRGVGVDNVDVPAATTLGIAVAYVPDASVEEVSDQALALLLASELELFAVQSAAHNGDLAGAATAASHSRRCSDLTLGIIGFGRIGRALARKSRGVFGEMLAADPYVIAEDALALGARLVTIEELLSTADLISLHTPGGSGPAPLIDRDALARMRPGARLVNTARGDLVDETALVHAVRNGHLASAALDVTREEPLPSGSPLVVQRGIYLTGHTGAKGQRSSTALREAVVQHVIAALEGRAPLNLANPEVLDSANCRITASGLPTTKGTPT